MASFEDRDLSFAPVQNSAPQKLTQQQIADYNELGYIKPLDVFNELESIRNRAYFDWILASLIAAQDGRDPYSVNGYHLRCRGLFDIARDPCILDYVQDLIGPDIICWGTHFFCKMPGDPKIVPWHQDASYWPFTPSRTVTVWLAIDDATIENAAMKFIPRTHNRGHLKWSETRQAAVLNQEIEDIESYGNPVYDELKAGQISLHADMLAHGSDANQSSRRRCGLTIRYCPPLVRAVEGSGWNAQSFIARGEDVSGHWSNGAVPVGEDFSPMGWQKVQAG